MSHVSRISFIPIKITGGLVKNLNTLYVLLYTLLYFIDLLWILYLKMSLTICFQYFFYDSINCGLCELYLYFKDKKKL